MSEQLSLRDRFIEHITLHSNFNRADDLASGYTHLLGAILSVIGTIVLVQQAMTECATSRSIVGASVFGASMILLYSSSSIYHLATGPVFKRVCRIMDHSTIYMLIAGTYTPIMLSVGGVHGYGVLIGAWSFTVLGIIFKLVFWGRYGIVHVLLYLLMGWMIVFIWRDVVAVLPVELLYWSIAGGLTYTAGTLVYALKKVPFHHAAWHLFVLGGSACFFFGIYLHLPCA
ncbi:MAG: DNA-binding protein [Spirochaetaceae bacterium]|nr:MAG: DNA-binding protein [Spirochaetaceae bacterium]